MGFYIELYCDTPECPFGNNQEGFSGTNRASIAADAKRHGWRKIGNSWRCKECLQVNHHP